MKKTILAAVVTLVLLAAATNGITLAESGTTGVRAAETAAASANTTSAANTAAATSAADTAATATAASGQTALLNVLQGVNTDNVVQMSSTYTYTQMCLDTLALCAIYPDYVACDVGGYSEQGLIIPYIVLGHKDAPHKVYVTSTMHAREYLNTQVLMKMIENYAKGYAAGQYQDMLGSTVYYIIPMVNPDGVQMVQTDKRFAGWKNNANGVNLNRNFSPGWENQENTTNTPDGDKFKGYAPETESEVQAMIAVGGLETWDFVLNFHQMGNVLYYGSPLASSSYNASCRSWAKTIRTVNGYTIMPCDTSESACGTFGDYIPVAYGCPYVTIETDNCLPPRGQTHASNVYARNFGVLEKISRTLSGT